MRSVRRGAYAPKARTTPERLETYYVRSPKFGDVCVKAESPFMALFEATKYFQAEYAEFSAGAEVSTLEELLDG